jgi:hypothetical protein
MISALTMPSDKGSPFLLPQHSKTQNDTIKNIYLSSEFCWHGQSLPSCRCVLRIRFLEAGGCGDSVGFGVMLGAFTVTNNIQGCQNGFTESGTLADQTIYQLAVNSDTALLEPLKKNAKKKTKKKKKKILRQPCKVRKAQTECRAQVPRTRWHETASSQHVCNQTSTS